MQTGAAQLGYKYTDCNGKDPVGKLKYACYIIHTWKQACTCTCCE